MYSWLSDVVKMVRGLLFKRVTDVFVVPYNNQPPLLARGFEWIIGNVVLLLLGNGRCDVT